MKRIRYCLLGLLLAAAALWAANNFVPNDQPYGYIAPPTISASNLSSGNEAVYTTWFENGTYQGDLIAFPVDATGKVDVLNPLWHANLKVEAQDWDTGRFIFTSDGSGNPVPFRYTSLTGLQQAALGLGYTVVDYVRGDRSQEIANGGSYRDRTSVMGDIIHGNPVYVGAPSAGYAFDAYLTFAVAHANRPPRVYVGGNDGMLHAFDADPATGGNEVFAFVPSAVIDNLAALTADPYTHQYYVDGPITVGDACFNCPAASPEWHTILVGGLGAGGRAYYALDITEADPVTAEDTTSGGAGNKYLWEFTHADLGYSYGRPSIVRLATGAWAVVIGNGYVNGGSGKASLFVLDAATGTLLRQLVVSTTTDSLSDPNGLSSPTVVDANGDFHADYVYAGDIKGNLWKFDISDPDPANWQVLPDPAGTTPLFVTDNGLGIPQAITTAPDVTFHPDGGLMVIFGTGRLFEQGDATSTATDSIYGIWDYNPWPSGYTFSRSDLVTQTLTELTHTASNARVRVASNYPVDYTIDANSGTPAHPGWVVDLPPGERLLQNLVIRDKRAQMITVNPTIQTGENWLIQLDYETGGAPDKIILDIDHNDVIDIYDNVDGNGDGDLADPEDRAVAEYQSFGLASAPAIAILNATQDTSLINHLHAINPAEIPPSPTDPGLLGGHFDLDTSHLIYDFNSGTTDHHVHQWDDKTGYTTIDYMDIVECSDPFDHSTCSNSTGFSDIDEEITDPNQKFILIIANASLSPGGVLEINGSNTGVVTYESAVADHIAGTSSLPVYKLGTLSATDVATGVQQLTSLKISFDVNAILTGGLIGTNTGCVRSNQPGALNEYRNGALLIQAVDANSYSLDPTNHYATSGLLWESTVFWHWDPSECYGDANYETVKNQCLADWTLCVKQSGSSGSSGSGSKSSSSKSSSKSSSSSSSSGSGSGSGSGSTTVVTPIDPQQDVTNTTGSGDNQSGRLLWRELIR